VEAEADTGGAWRRSHRGWLDRRGGAPATVVRQTARRRPKIRLTQWRDGMGRAEEEQEAAAGSGERSGGDKG
jgi:hypothetical protein